MYWPSFRASAQRRELGRGMQSVVEFFFASDDLFVPLAHSNQGFSEGRATLVSTVEFRYAGPYSVDIRISKRPAFFVAAQRTNLTVSIRLTPESGVHAAHTFEGQCAMPWGVDSLVSFTLNRFDVPTDLPMDVPIKAEVTVTGIPDDFFDHYGDTANIVIARASSE